MKFLTKCKFIRISSYNNINNSGASFLQIMFGFIYTGHFIDDDSDVQTVFNPIIYRRVTLSVNKEQLYKSSFWWSSLTFCLTIILQICLSMKFDKYSSISEDVLLKFWHETNVSWTQLTIETSKLSFIVKIGEITNKCPISCSTNSQYKAYLIHFLKSLMYATKVRQSRFPKFIVLSPLSHLFCFNHTLHFEFSAVRGFASHTSE